MTTERFYAELPIIDRFIDITVSANFVPVPNDWYIVATDIVGSTEAISQGRYKAVNFVGAAAIVSLLNIAGSLEIPFVFGGDGASLLIPGHLLPAARQALLANQAIAQRDFQLELRVGIIPVAHVTSDRDLLIAKFRVSENYDQAIARYEHDLTVYLYQQLNQIPQLTLYGPQPKADGSGRVALATFTVEGIHAQDLSTLMDQSGVAIRSGHHCTQPLHRHLGVTSTARASLYFYNTTQEIDTFIAALKDTIEFFGSIFDED